MSSYHIDTNDTTVPTTKQLRFSIFSEIFKNFQLKTLLNSKILQIVTVFF